MDHKADVTAAAEISDNVVLPQPATNAVSREGSHHCRLRVERPFTAQERDRVTHV
jgi:hypothetical protein